MPESRLKPIVIVTYSFAPETHAAMFRMFKLAKYLPRHGYRPIVVRPDTNYLYKEDPSLLDELPPEVEIVKARYVEPTLRGLRMALGGEDLTYKAVRARQKDGGATSSEAGASRGQGAAGGLLGPLRGPVAKAYRTALETIVHSPDPYWTWRRPATEAAWSAAQRSGARLVLTCTQPFTTLAIGRDLQERGLRWVADFRDPLPLGRKFMSSVPSVHEAQQKLVRLAVEEADHLTALTSVHPMLLHDFFGHAGRTGMSFITTGIDEAYIPAPAPDGAGGEEPYLIHVGELHRAYGTSFLDVFERVRREEEAAGRRLRLRLIGSLDINSRVIAPEIASRGLAPYVDLVEHQNQREVYRQIRGARAAVLLPGKFAHWWNSFAKLVDYIGLRVPVLADVPDPSEARKQLTRSGLGVFLDGTIDEQVETCRAFLQGRVPVRPVEAVCNEYLAGAQVTAFARVFDEVLGRP
jgi:hypothetical protein